MSCSRTQVLWVGMQCVIVVFPDHTHLLFRYKGKNKTALEIGVRVASASS